MSTMRLYLRANEKIFINGAVLRADRKVAIELLNDATFLLENHVLQKEEATTPLKQLYFVVQMLFMDPNNIEQPMGLFKQMVANLLENLDTPELIKGVKEVDVDVSTGKPFNALKTIRSLYALEEDILSRAEQKNIERLTSEPAEFAGEQEPKLAATGA